MTAEIDGAVPSHKFRRISTIELSILNEALQSKKGAAVVFIPIGGNDGMLADPRQAYVNKNGWAGAILEPVPPYFREHQKNYQGFPRVELRNVAAGQPGNASISYATDGAISTAHRTLGQGVADDEILEVEVPMPPLAQVFTERSWGFDLLVMGVGGTEPVVLDSMDWHSPDSFAIAVDETPLLAGFMESERLLDQRLQNDLINMAGSRELVLEAGSPALRFNLSTRRFHEPSYFLLPCAVPAPWSND